MSCPPPTRPDLPRQAPPQVDGAVYFVTLADLVGALAKAEREGALREKIRLFCRFSLLIVDEIGYLPVIPGGGNLFFQLVKDRHSFWVGSLRSGPTSDA